MLKQTPKKNYKELNQAAMVDGIKYCLLHNGRHYIIKKENNQIYKLVEYDFATGMNESWKPLYHFKDIERLMCVANRMDIVRAFEELKKIKKGV